MLWEGFARTAEELCMCALSSVICKPVGESSPLMGSDDSILWVVRYRWTMGHRRE